MVAILKMAAIFVPGQIWDGPLSPLRHCLPVEQIPYLFHQTYNSSKHFTYLQYYSGAHIPNGILIASRFCTAHGRRSLCTCTFFLSKLPPCMGIWTPILYTVRWAHLNPHPKWHLRTDDSNEPTLIELRFLRHTRHKIVHFGDVLPSQPHGIVLEKLNPTQQKQTTQEQNSLS